MMQPQQHQLFKQLEVEEVTEVVPEGKDVNLVVVEDAEAFLVAKGWPHGGFRGSPRSGGRGPDKVKFFIERPARTDCTI